MTAVATMPPYVPELRSRDRPRGLPTLGEAVLSPPDEELDSSATPFRLPRMGTADKQTEESCKIWSRFGYEYHNQKPLDVNNLTSRLKTNPHALSQEARRANMHWPKFHHAMITPAQSYPAHPRLFAQDFSDPAFFKSFVYRRGRGQQEESFPELDPAPSPSATRCITPAKSAKSIHWTLASYRNFTLDKKGRSRAQGPFSRGFTVHCSAPDNWLKMKLGRSKTTFF